MGYTRGDKFVSEEPKRRKLVKNRTAEGPTLSRNLETARKAFKAGVKFAMGSDAIYTMFGQNTRELGWFVKTGMTPEQTLHAATTNAAELLGKEKELGAAVVVDKSKTVAHKSAAHDFDSPCWAPPERTGR